MQIYLIGSPRIVDDEGDTIKVPGHQPWAVLARLLLAERPLSRRQIANELFGETNDPLGALRWCLATLRRALGSQTLHGDPVSLNLPAGTVIDFQSLGTEDFEAIEPAEFMQGIEPVAAADFSTWLLIAREQVAGRLYEHFHRSAIDALARGNSEAALSHAERATRQRPLDESGHILLVKALAQAGKSEAALAHIEAVDKEFQSALGERPSRALRQAARANIADPPKGVSDAAIIDSLIKSGTAAVSAGAVDAGIDCLRRAVARAEDGNDNYLVARTLHELGTALVHAIRGFDDEGAVLLRQAADKAVDIGASGIAASSYRELGYIEALAGRRPAAATYLQEALEYADNDPDVLAGIHAMTGFNLVDWGQHQMGLSEFEKAISVARSCGNRRREIWALGIGGWGQLRAANPSKAEQWLLQSIQLCEEIRWVAFQPWPQAMLFEARLLQARLDNSAAETLDEALALSGQLADPCWEAANARAIALLHQDSDDLDSATDWLQHARAKCCAVTDLYAGLLVQILADQLQVEKQRQGDNASTFARELISLAARTHADAYLDQAMDNLSSTNQPS